MPEKRPSTTRGIRPRESGEDATVGVEEGPIRVYVLPEFETPKEKRTELEGVGESALATMGEPIVE